MAVEIDTGMRGDCSKDVCKLQKMSRSKSKEQLLVGEVGLPDLDTCWLIAAVLRKCGLFP